jgi:hypothetical protein
MDVVSICPLRALGFIWQLRASTFVQTVVVKASYVLRPGESALAPEQDAPNDADIHFSNDATRSIYAPGDRAPFKPQADVVLVGHAYAPGGQPARVVNARMTVGALDRSIQVWCDRALRRADGQILEGQPFTTMPLQWERAAGGHGTINPIGMSFDAPPDARGMIPVPNLQPPGASLSKPSDAFAPVCFAPVAAHWPGRRMKFGRHAGTLSLDGWETRPLPDDLDFGFFQVAPPEQQVSEIHANERIVLENLHSDHARLVTSLPGVRPRGMVERPTGEREEIMLTADTLWINTDQGICVMIWRGKIGLRNAGEAGRITVSMVHGAHMGDAEAPQVGGRQVGEIAATPARKLDPEMELAKMTMPPSTKAGKGAESVMPFVFGGLPSPPFSRKGPDDWPTGNPFPQKPGFSAPSPPPVIPPSAAERLKMLETIPPPTKTTSAWVPGPSDPYPAPMQVHPAPAHEILRPPSSAPPQLGAAIDALPKAPEDSSRKPRWKPLVAGDEGGPQPAAPVSPDLALGGAVAASNAAADAQRAPATAAATIASAKAAAPRSIPKEVVELLWMDPSYVPRLRRMPAYKEIMAQVKPTPLDDDYPGEAAPDKRQVLRDQREVFGLLARGQPLSAQEVDAALAEAVRDDGTFVPPLVLVRGELELPFDELETLKATIAAITPLTAGDKRLKEAVDTTQELLKTPWLSGASGVTDGLLSKLKEVFAQGSRVLPARYLETHTERMLLDQRAYQRRTVLGKRCIRSLILLPGSLAPIPVYLPEALGPELPSFQRFTVRMLAEARVHMDQHELQATALRTIALGRVLKGLRGKSEG